jgi:hypothetical protein
MAFKSKDGKSFGNRQRQTAYDERPAKKEAKAEPTEHQEPDGDEQSPQDIHEMVAQHGPAEKIEITHDHAAGKHTVVSHHGGKTHKSEHASAHEAHAHAMTAAGAEPMQEEQPQMAGAGAMQQGGIPGM